MRRGGLFLAALAVLPVALGAGEEGGVREADLRLHAGVLLSSEMAVGGPGEPGCARASAYAISALRRAGFEPLPGGDYGVPVALTLAGSGTGTSLEASGLSEFAPGEDGRTLPISADADATGPLLFAGYGLTGADPAWDDYAGIDVAGRVVLVVDGGPPGAVVARTPTAIAAAAAERGAAAVLLVSDPRTSTFDEVTFADGRRERGRIQDRGTEFLFAPRSGGRPRRLTVDQVREIRLAVPPGPPGPGGFVPAPAERRKIPVLGISVPTANRLLGRSLQTALDGMDMASRPGSFLREDVVVAVRARVALRPGGVEHVVGIRTGADPAVRGEAVLVSAPLEGDGEGGAALVLAIADALGREPPLKRTVVLVLRAAGDRGDLGLAELRRRLRFPAERIRGAVCLEARGRAPAIVSPDGEEFGPLRLRAAEARLRTALVPGGDGTLLVPIYPGRGPRTSLLAPGLPRPDDEGNVRAALDTARLALALVKDRADAPVPEPVVRKPEEKPAPPPPPAPTFERARAARFAGKLAVAKSEIAGALAAHPGDAELYLERGRIHVAAKEFDAALADADQIEKLAAGDGRAWHLRAEAHLAAGREAEGLGALEKAIETGRAAAMLDRALMLLESSGAGEREKAIERYLSAAVAADAGGAVGAAAEGILAILGGEPAKAEEALARAVEADPSLAAAWYWRGTLALEIDRDPATGETYFGRALECGIEPGGACFQRGMCRLMLRKFTLAIRDFERAVGAGASVDSAIYNIACAHARMGNRAEALEWLARAVLAGFDDADHARTDPDLEILRGDAAFERILRSGKTD